LQAKALYEYCNQQLGIPIIDLTKPKKDGTLKALPITTLRDMAIAHLQAGIAQVTAKIREISRKAKAPPLPDVLELMQQPAAIVSEQYLQVIEYVSHAFRLVLFGCRLQLHISDAIAARRLLSLVLPTCPTM
jgi:hypothetical protein